MNPVRRMEIKRDAWKRKAVQRATQLRASRKEIRRLKKVIRALKDSAHSENNSDQLPALGATPNSPEGDPPSSEAVNETRRLCVMFVIAGVQSFRSIPRTLSLVQWRGWVPHFTSVINWTLRVGLALLTEVKPLTDLWIAIIDSSHSCGNKKLLVVLAVPISALVRRKSALTLEDVQCLSVETIAGLNGEKVYEALHRIPLMKAPIAVVEDSGKDLTRGIKYWRRRDKYPDLEIIQDVGHFAANALKNQYRGLSIFKSFLKTISLVTRRLKLTELAFLMPPKLRTVGRFMSISKLARWGEKILLLLRNQQQIKALHVFHRLKGLVRGLARYRMFIRNFNKVCDSVNGFLKILKNDGLNQASFERAKQILEELPKNNQVRIRLSEWLERHMKIHTNLELGDVPLLVSSDIIESLFGKFKSIIARSPRTEFNRMVLTIPTLCGCPSTIDVIQKLKTVSHRDLLRWVKENVQTTQWQLRQAFNRNQLHLMPVPKTGNKNLKAA